MTFGLGRIAGVFLLASSFVTALSARGAERTPAPDSGQNETGRAISFARTCDADGAGYFTLPGSDLCLNFGGRAFSDLALRHVPLTAFTPNPGAPLPSTSRAPNPSSVGGGVGLGISIGARLPTEAGPVSGYVDVTTVFGAGLLSPNPAGVYSPQADLNGVNPNAWLNFTRLDQAWLQWAGWTAGRTQSIFDFYADAYNIMPLRGSNAHTELLAYRFEPTPGVMAALALENNRERRNLVGQAVNPGASADYSGAGFPDPVAALRVESPFGVAQLSGAAHELRTRYAAPESVAPGQPDASTSTQWGFAAQGGLKVNLPNLSDADAMILQATYARGASAYLTGDNQPLFAGVNDPSHPGIANPRLAAAPGLTSYDYDCVTTTQQPFGKCDQSSGYALIAAFKHFWTPTVSSSLFASFFGMNYTDAARTGAPGVAGASNYRETSVGANLTWTPLKNLMVGGEVAFTQGKASGAAPVTPQQPNSPAWPTANEWSGRIRVQHNF
jgi:Porin subfamily